MNSYKKVVIKIGSALINDKQTDSDEVINSLCSQISTGTDSGIKFAVVSSGAISQGLSYLEMSERPDKLDQLQALAAIGQQQLMQMYEKCFARDNKKIAQVLLTHDDMNNTTRYLNAKATFDNLLSLNVIPIINENDVVATELNSTIYRIAGDGTEEHTAKISIDFSVKDDVFGNRDFVIINL